MQPERLVLHMISAAVIAIVGFGVCLWSFMTPRVRWDRLWIGLFLMLFCAPVAGAVTIMRMANAWERRGAADGELRSEVVVADSAVSHSAEAAAEDANLGR